MVLSTYFQIVSCNVLIENKVSSFQSSFSLQNSIFKYSFPKTNRFIQKSPPSDVIYNIPTELSTKATSLGFGRKSDLADKNAKDTPSANNYVITSLFDKNIKEKKGYPIASRYNEVTRSLSNFPGPGEYNLKNNEYKHKVLVTIKPRLMFFYGKLI